MAHVQSLTVTESQDMSLVEHSHALEEVTPDYLSLDEIKDLYPGLRVWLEKPEEGVIGYSFTFSRADNPHSTSVDDVRGLDVTINTRDSLVTVSKWDIIQGTNKHSGKQYRRRRKTQRISFTARKSKAGVPYVTVYFVSLAGKKAYNTIQNVTFSFLHSYFSTQRPPRFGRNLIEMLVPQGEPADVERLAELSQPLNLNELKSVPLTVSYSELDAVSVLVMQCLYLMYKKRRPDFSHPITDPLWLHYACYPSSEFLSKPALTFKSELRGGSFLNNGSDFKVWVRKTFGKAAVRKDFIKALTSCADMDLIYLAHELRGLIKPDWFITLMKNDPHEDTRPLLLRGFHRLSLDSSLRKLFLNLTLSERKRLLFQRAGENSASGETRMRIAEVSDLLRLASSATQSKAWAKIWAEELWSNRRVRSFKEYHDWFSDTYDKISRESLPIPQGSHYEKLDNTNYTIGEDTYTVITPKETYDLILWGKELRNCIGGYDQEVLSGDTHVYAIRKNNDENLYAAVEYHEGKVKQYMEKFNKAVPTDVSQGFLHHVQQLQQGRINSL